MLKLAIRDRIGGKRKVKLLRPDAAQFELSFRLQWLHMILTKGISHCKSGRRYFGNCNPSRVRHLPVCLTAFSKGAGINVLAYGTVEISRKQIHLVTITEADK